MPRASRRHGGRQHGKEGKCSSGDCSSSLRSSLQRILSSKCKENKGRGAGMIRIERNDGSLLFQSTSGKSGCREEEGGGGCCGTLTCDWPIEIASVTKMVTSACVLQLVDNNIISLDDAIFPLIESRIPPSVIRKGFGTFDEKKKRGGAGGSRRESDGGCFSTCFRRPSTGSQGEDDDDDSGSTFGTFVLPTITIRQCLQHTSGLPEYWDSSSFKKAFEEDEQKWWTPEECLEYATPSKKGGGGISMHFRPGEEDKFYYADTNYILLGYLIEEAGNDNKMKLEEIFKERIFDVLEMEDTYAEYRENKRGDKCCRYPIVRRFEGKRDVCEQVRQTAEWAGGGLVSTLDDMARFVKAFIGRQGEGGGGVQRLLSSSLRKKFDNEIIPTDNYFKSDDVSYGLGVMDIDYETFGHYVGHDGHGNVFAYAGQQRGGYIVVGTLNQLDTDWTDMWLEMLEAIKEDGGGRAAAHGEDEDDEEDDDEEEEDDDDDDDDEDEE